MCRIVYHTRVNLRSFRLYKNLSIAQWILGFLQLLPSLCIGDIDYLPTDYHCQLSPKNLHATLTGLSILFLIPLSLTLICYVCTMYYVRSRNIALGPIGRSSNIHRDLTVFTRLVILLTFVTTVALPHVLIPIAYVANDYLPLWTSPFEWSLTLFSLICVAITQIFVSSHLKKIFTWPIRVHMTTVLPYQAE
ncbi:unnamed protein product [Rotaria sp. Silwood2]|nr:unnamed protein product [Rotaria sp. Silwood2]CAF4574580.1 unnamed protein product [Rotaria sp. Silwood2]